MRKYILWLPITSGNVLLNCTLVQSFKTRHSAEYIADKLRRRVMYPRFELTAVRLAFFGPDNNVPVHLVESIPATILEGFHREICPVLTLECAAEFCNPEWNYGGYRPHVAFRQGRCLPIGEKVMVEYVQLWEWERDRKVMRREMPLSAD